MKRDLHRNAKRVLANKHACYILITCDEPTDDGEMSVEMSYEGDAMLASYLLQGAQTVVDNDVQELEHESADNLRLVEKCQKR